MILQRRAPLARCPKHNRRQVHHCFNLRRAAGQENGCLTQSRSSQISTEMILLSSRTQLFKSYQRSPSKTHYCPRGSRLQNATFLWKKRKTQNSLQIQNLVCTLDFKPFFFQSIPIFLTITNSKRNLFKFNIYLPAPPILSPILFLPEKPQCWVCHYTHFYGRKWDTIKSVLIQGQSSREKLDSEREKFYSETNIKDNYKGNIEN